MMRSQLSTYIWKKWNWNTLVIGNIFSFQVAIDTVRNYEDPKPKTMDKCQHKKKLAKMERIYSDKIRLIWKIRSI